MGNYVPAVTLGPIDFDGDSITIEARRLTTEDMQALSPHIDREKGVIGFESVTALCSLAAAIFPKRLIALRGMKHPDGREFTLDEFLAVVSEFYFSPLVGVVLAKLIDASTVRQVAAKN